MSAPSCRCQCKRCRASDADHCRSSPTCRAPRTIPTTPAARLLYERLVAEALGRLKASSGTHSPSVAELERALPGAVRIDACSLSNPYATDAVMPRLRAITPAWLERMVSHHPSQGAVIASVLAPSVGVPADQLVVANGACEVIAALLAHASGPLLVSLPTFSAYYEFASGPVVTHHLDPAHEFRLDFGELEALVDRHAPDTVVVINPNNPDGGLAAHENLVRFVERMRGRVRQVIVDESFGAFSSPHEPATLAPLIGELPHLVVVNSLSKSHGIAGLRLGYAVATPPRARQLRGASLWNLNALAEWFCELLADNSYRREYESARRRYIRETRRMFAGLAALPGTRAYPSAANFALLELDCPAADVATALLVRHGVYVRDCADKRGLDGDRYLRVAARSEPDNDRVLDALTDVLTNRPANPSATTAEERAPLVAWRWPPPTPPCARNSTPH
jgi:histidinol-phosphate/aromatic aminotransferase/cobyric acid decarboxylase-like protein